MSIPSDPGGELRRPQLFLAMALSFVLVLGIISAALFFNRQPTSSQGSSPTETSTPSVTATPTPTPTPSPAPPPPPPPETEPPRAAMNILLIGSDIRGNAREAEAARSATGQRPDHRADALMLVHVPADRHAVYGVSLMRDLWVNIPGYGGSKINASLEAGGVPMVTQTVGSLLNTPIHHTVLVDFEGFRWMVNAVGGVEVNVTVPFTSTSESRHYFPPGMNRLMGNEALQFVRERYAFSDGDYQRVRNQQTLLRAVLTEAHKKNWLADPAAARSLVSQVFPLMTVDQSMDATSLAWLAYSLRSTSQVVFFTLPTAGTGFSPDGQSIVLQDPAATAAVGAAFAEGRIGEYVAANGLGAGN
ncbi:LCP family protein [Arthrobacter sp. R4-81]